MDALVTILLVVLVCVATLPLLALAVYALASALGLSIADRILETTMSLLKAQWTLGGVVNMLVGAGLIGLGLWCALTLHLLVLKALCLILLPFGVWRLVRGVAIVRAATRSGDRN
ncbi:hypothetical protein [Agreia sp. Leaf210]|uniref:hypothetical protein n=1 Tax=Agreia sp. Leaf210 TaxID=1735682 RepID=UPI0006FA9219|nr:hypothetical protein [Agreia sp. Leaf210]KQM59492.1 hypothetical protein ASE64_09085 [Agreia sp. Leaf210]